MPVAVRELYAGAGGVMQPADDKFYVSVHNAQTGQVENRTITVKGWSDWNLVKSILDK